MRCVRAQSVHLTNVSFLQRFTQPQRQPRRTGRVWHRNKYTERNAKSTVTPSTITRGYRDCVSAKRRLVLVVKTPPGNRSGIQRQEMNRCLAVTLKSERCASAAVNAGRYSTMCGSHPITASFDEPWRTKYQRHRHRQTNGLQKIKVRKYSVYISIVLNWKINLRHRTR